MKALSIVEIETVILAYRVAHNLVNKEFDFPSEFSTKSLLILRKRMPKRPKTPIWCRIVDAFQAAATLAQEDDELRHLAEQFRLADNLIPTTLDFPTLGQKCLFFSFP